MKHITYLFAAVIIFSTLCAPFQATATETQGVITKYDLTVEEMTTNAYSYTEQALQYAKENATDSTPVTVTLPSGTYNLSGCLHIYSNTKLILQQDTVLIKTSSSGNMLKAGIQTESNYGYDGYKNITISGGVWDENFKGESCGMRFAHCSNVTIQNLTIKNNKNSHHLEFAAANNFNILNCTFTGYKRSNGGDGMAVQIDNIHNTSHFPSYAYYDDTPCKNITVKGCKFIDVYSGVGSYSGVAGSYFSNIVIENNYFEKVRDKAIALFNATKSYIRYNTIKYATIGIMFEYYPSDGSNNRLFAPNSSTASRAVKSNTKCTISDNSITVYKYVGRSNSSGIAVYGGMLSDSKKKSLGVSTNNLLVKELLINNNKIKVSGSTSSGLWLQYMYNSNVLNNSVSASGSTGGYNGVLMYHSRGNYVKSNRISKFNNSVMLKSYSKKNDFYSNKFKNASGFGVSVDNTSGAYINYGNSFKKNAAGKVNLRGNVYGSFASQLKRLRVEDKQLKWFRYKDASGYVVYRSTKKKSGYTKLKTVKEKPKFKTVKVKNDKGEEEEIQKEIKKDRSFTDKTAKKGKKYYYKIMVYRKYKGSFIYGSTSKPFKIKY